MGRKLLLIVTGTGRCGTKFVSRLLTGVGLPCGHETFFTWRGLEGVDRNLAWHHPQCIGDCSWQAAPFLETHEALRDAFVIHLLRHPKAYIDSHLKLWPEGHRTPFSRFVCDQLPEITLIDDMDDRFTWEAYKWIHWNRMIERATKDRPHVQFQIEREPMELLEALADNGLLNMTGVDPNALYDDRRCNHMRDNETDVQLEDIRDERVRRNLLELAGEYGYTWENA